MSWKRGSPCSGLVERLECFKAPRWFRGSGLDQQVRSASLLFKADVPAHPMACWCPEGRGGLCLVTCRVPRSLYFYSLLCCLFLTYFAAAAAAQPTNPSVLPALASPSRPPRVLRGEPACSRCRLFTPAETRSIRCDHRHLTGTRRWPPGHAARHRCVPSDSPSPDSGPEPGRGSVARRPLHQPPKRPCRAPPVPAGLAVLQEDERQFLQSCRPQSCRQGGHSPRRKGLSLSAGPRCAPDGRREPMTLGAGDAKSRAGVKGGLVCTR